MRRSYTMFAIDRLLPSLIVNRFKSLSWRNAQSVVPRHGAQRPACEVGCSDVKESEPWNRSAKGVAGFKPESRRLTPNMSAYGKGERKLFDALPAG